MASISGAGKTRKLHVKEWNQNTPYTMFFTVLVPQSHLTLCDPMDVACQVPLSMGFPRQECGVGCHFLLQGIFPAQRSNARLLLGRQILYHWDTWNASLIPYTEINSKWIKALTVRPDAIKPKEKNIGKTLYDINHSKIFFDPPPSVRKTKINEWDLIKLKSFCTAKETINKMKIQSSEWEKIFANKANDKGLIS